MKFEEILKGLEDGSITVNLMGHAMYTPKEDWWGEWENFNLLKMMKTGVLYESYTKEYDMIIQLAEEKHNDGSWSDMEYKGMIDYAKTYLSYVCKIDRYSIRFAMNVEIGECLLADAIMSASPFFICKACGGYVFPYLYSENEIRFQNYKRDCNDRCDAELLKSKKYIESEITVTEKLGFANCFNENHLNQPDPEKLYDINYISGRYQLMQDCAKENIGYCQCDSCGCEVYMNRARTKIIVTKHRTLALDAKYVWQGYIDFQVWSYRCADTAKIKEYVENYDELVEEHPREIGKNYFEVDIKPGKYRIRHYDRMPVKNIWTTIEKID